MLRLPIALLALTLGACISKVAPDAGAQSADTRPAAADASDPADAEPEDIGVPDAAAPVNPLTGAGAVERVAQGLVFTEGPRWFEGRLLFSDIPADTIYALDAPGSISVFRKPSRNSNGLAVDPQGRLLTAEHGARRVSRTLGDGTIEAVVTHFEGDRLNSPNDLVVRSDGTIYFTDPEWGIAGDLTQRELDVNGLYRVDPAGAVTREWSTPWVGHPDTPRPNGVVLSADEATLYMGEDRDREVLLFDVAASGALTGPRARWTTGATPDGLAMDLAGNLYVATAPGVEVFAPDGTRWGLLEIPGGSNVAFGEADARTLYVTAGPEVFRVRLRQAGLR